MEISCKIRPGEPPADCTIHVTEETRENLKDHKIVAGCPLIESYEMFIRRLLCFIDEIDPDGEKMWNLLSYGDLQGRPHKRSRKGE